MRKAFGVNILQKLRNKRTALKLGIGVLAVIALILAISGNWLAGSGTDAPVAVAQAQRGPLLISVTESGTITNKERKLIKSEVEGSTTILYLVPEGANVKKGDLLVELDSSKLQDQKTQQQITVMNCEASFIRARENLAVTISQGESDVAKAELAYKFAQIDLAKYQEGEHPQAIHRADADIEIAGEELKRAADKLDWSRRLEKQGYITRTELQADELAAKRAKTNLDLAESSKRLLIEFTHQRQLDQLRSDVTQAAQALERTKRKVAADRIQAEAELTAKESELKRQKANLEKTENQIAKCRIEAPVDGMVVYATTGQQPMRRTEPLAEGSQVRERQELIYLPTDLAMQVETRIHEASLRKVRVGMPVRVTVDAVPGKIFWGTVSRIGLLPDAQSAWLNPDLKVYTTLVDIKDQDESLRPGMSCHAEIIVEHYQDAVYVPVQSVVQVAGSPVVYIPGKDHPIMTPIKIGLDNNRMVRVIEGLVEGQSVLLSPPLDRSAVAVDAAARDIPATLPALAAPAVAQSQPAQQPNAMPFDMAKMRLMTPEQQREAFQKLTPEQREQLMKQFGGRRRPREPGQGRPPQ